MHDVADLTPLSNSQMEIGIRSTVETEQDQGNLGVKHGNEVNEQPVSANESESLFLSCTEEMDSSQAHRRPGTDANNNVVTQQLVNAQTNTAKATKARPKQLRIVKHPASHPTKSQLDYQTDDYPVYDPQIDNRGPKVIGPFRMSYNIYMMATHFTSGVRLDDLTVSKVLGSSLRRLELNKYWQSEFDRNAMVRATCVPLGHAAKAFKKVGDIDTDGNIIAEGQQGWYYLWWTGLHLLCGKEGLDAGMYMVRPSFEKKRVPTFSWKISHRAVIQSAPGQVESRHDFTYESPDNWGNGGFCGY
ncbi:MAG: hypothetical protein Q9212_007124 [Teloschistes hypoglaucus]